MSSNNNISVALDVVRKTYENIDLFIDYCKTLCKENDDIDYFLLSEKYLREISTTTVVGTLVKGLVLLFQKKSAPAWRDGNEQQEVCLRNGKIYSLFIDLYEFNKYPSDHPVIYLTRYKYDDMARFPDTFGLRDYFRFVSPIRPHNGVKLTFTDDKDSIYSGEPYDNTFSDNNWYGFRKLVGFHIPLVDVKKDNVKDLIFGGFDKLEEMAT